MEANNELLSKYDDLASEIQKILFRSYLNVSLFKGKPYFTPASNATNQYLDSKDLEKLILAVETLHKELLKTYNNKELLKELMYQNIEDLYGNITVKSNMKTIKKSKHRSKSWIWKCDVCNSRYSDDVQDHYYLVRGSIGITEFHYPHIHFELRACNDNCRNKAEQQVRNKLETESNRLIAEARSQIE